jgi:ubiquinone/menaquinone biosynthesis C-methylase UbiE
MEDLLLALRAAAEPTRLRLLALASSGAFCGTEIVAILGQSQPRLSRHLRLLTEAGLLLRIPDGAFIWFALPDAATPRGQLARALVDRLPADDALLAADRRAAAEVLTARARAASESFRRLGADWDEMHALGLPAEEVESAMGAIVGQGQVGRLLDIGTGTGRVLELLAPRLTAGIGVDISPQMVAFTRGRLAQSGIGQCSVRQADMYHLPFPDGDGETGFDCVVLQMVLHHAAEPEAVLREAARVLRTGMKMVVVDLAAHGRKELTDRLAHRHQGFHEEQMRRMLNGIGLTLARTQVFDGPLTVQIWSGNLNRDADATRSSHAAQESASP